MGEGRELGLRERKKIATRRALQQHTIRLVIERGLDNVTVEEITAAAEVSPRTFFNYFPSKEEALVGHHPSVPDEDARQLFVSGGPTGKLVDDLKHYLSQQAEEGTPSPEDLRLRHRLLEQEPQLTPLFLSRFAKVEQAVAEAVAERIGDAPGNVRPQLIAAVGAAALRLAIRRWKGEDSAGSLSDAIDESFGALNEVF
ncbi:acyl-CoA-like ligand-binding transcription factor [Salinactinospora qingdaonensis]|uniref:TetR family transcriptional regulator n=1 Tax=Salinactinospora qingdaonensis TaxID=702744 RepID=A0ABP7ETR0_9ACTN